MKNLLFKSTRIIFLCFCSLVSFAQHQTEEKEKFSPHTNIGIVLGHAHLSDGRDENGKKKTVTLPSWGLDFNYYFHPKWGIGLHTDFIIEKFRVADENDITVERTTPVAPAIMAMFKPTEHWSFLCGVGGEFAKEGNLFLNRLGVEYGTEIRKGWEVEGSLSYDIKWNAYDTWVIGIGIAKNLGRKHM